jgi:sialate O-acetylesterase
MALPGTGQVVVTDLVDNLKDIHPPYKWEVGRRLALWALKNTYHSYNGEYTGPLFQSARRRGDRLELTFIHTGTGLTAGWHDSTDNRFIPVSDARLEWFEVAGNDGVFYPAEARVHHNKVVVYSTAVSQPVMVRFAWNERAMPNFFNSEGLPAVPFTVSF